MKNNLSLILNIILFVAVAVLYYDEFVEDLFEEDETDEEQVEEVDAGRAGEAAIAYVNTDSLLANYKYFEKVSKELEKKRSKLQREYTRRAEVLQKQFEDYQRTMGNMTIGQARAVEEDLTRKRENLLKYQESVTQDLMRREAEITQELYQKVADFLKEYGKQQNLQIVLSYSPGSGVLFADEALDITDAVIAGLNEDFEQAENPATKTDSTAAEAQ